MTDKDFDWKKEKRPEPFDFDSYLDDSDYIPRHLSKASKKPLQEEMVETAMPPVSPVTKTPQAAELPTQEAPLTAPPRPQILVQQPRSQVVITPELEYEDEPTDQKKHGASGILWILLAAIAILLILVFAVGRNNTPDPNDPNAQSIATMRPKETAPPQQEAQPTEPPAPETVRYTVSVTAGTGGYIDPGGSVSVEEGSDVSFHVIPDDGYIVSQLLVDGVPQDSVGNFTLYDVRSDHTVYAVFLPEPEPESTPEPDPTPEPAPEPEPEPEEPEQEAEEPEALELSEHDMGYGRQYGGKFA